MLARAQSRKSIKTLVSSQPFFITAGLAYIGLYALGISTLPEPGRIWVGAFGRLIPLLAATWYASRIQRRLSGLRIRQAWNYFCAAGLLWSAGYLVKAAAMLVSHQTGLAVNFGDLFILAAYPAVFVGLVKYLPIALRTYGRLRLVLDLVIGCVGTLSLAGLLLAQQTLPDSGFQLAPVVWGFAFPLADLAVLILLVNILIVSEPGQASRAFLPFMAGLACILASDVMHAYWSLRDVAILTRMESAGWTAGNVIFTVMLATNLGNEALNVSLPQSTTVFKRQLQQALPVAVTGMLIWFAVLSSQLNEPQGIIVAWIAGVCLLTLILRQGVTAGEVELQEYTQLVNSVAEPSFVCDARGKLKLANPALDELCGCYDSSMVGRHIVEIFPDAEWQKGKASGGWSAELDLVDPAGIRIPVYLSLRPVQRLNSRKPGLAGSAHDLRVHRQQQHDLQMAYLQVAAARKQLEELNAGLEEKVSEKTRSLSEALQRVEEQNRILQTLDQLKTDFVSLVSHELRAPLTNVAGGIELVLSNPEALRPEVQESLGLVQKEILRLSQFVESILDLSALEAGHVPVYPAPLSLVNFIERLSERWLNPKEASRFTISIPKDLPDVCADERALTSVFFHLMDNAQKYAPGSPILISGWQEDGLCYVSVEDSGPGFPSEGISSIFDKFTRLQSADAQTVYGRGLGLYMTRKLLQAMGGDIQAGNRPEGGARFVLWLPAIKEGYE